MQDRRVDLRQRGICCDTASVPVGELNEVCGGLSRSAYIRRGLIPVGIYMFRLPDFQTGEIVEYGA